MYEHLGGSNILQLQVMLQLIVGRIVLEEGLLAQWVSAHVALLGVTKFPFRRTAHVCISPQQCMSIAVSSQPHQQNVFILQNCGQSNRWEVMLGVVLIHIFLIMSLNIFSYVQGPFFLSFLCELSIHVFFPFFLLCFWSCVPQY